MTRQREFGHGRALVVLLVSVSVTAAWVGVGQPHPGGRGGPALSLCVPIVVVGLLLWRQRSRRHNDRAADERLQLQLDRTCLPDVVLLCVLGTQWHGPAGQLASTVNVATGRADRQWFALASFADGSLVLMQRAPSGDLILDWMAPAEVAAAFRHRARRARATGRVSLAGRVRSWRSRARLVAEVEQALKRGDAEAAASTLGRADPQRGPGTQRPARWTP